MYVVLALLMLMGIIQKPTLRSRARSGVVVEVCATNWKVAGSNPDGVTGLFH
jgi:uncharacterized membrane protein